MNMAISKKDVKLLLYVGGILLLVVTFFFGYKKFMEKREVLLAEQAELQSQVNRLNEIYLEKDHYPVEIEAYDLKMHEIFEEYPAMVREEDAVLYANNIEDSCDIDITNIIIANPSQLYSLDDTLVVNGEVISQDLIDSIQQLDESLNPTGEGKTGEQSPLDAQLGILDENSVQLPYISLFNTAASYDFTTNYADCKSVVAMILACVDRRNVSSISLAYDTETGLLSGNMNVNMYFMVGTGKTYDEPDSGVIMHGRDDLFGTVERGRNDKK